MTSNEFYTWASLGTFAGAMAAVLLIVQYLKLPLDRVYKVPTRLVVLAVSAVIQVSVHLFGGGGFVVTDLPLMLVNSFLIALAAMGAYENTFAGLDEKNG